MPTFELTSPDGTKYQVDGPDGATPGQAYGVLQQHLQKPASNTSAMRRDTGISLGAPTQQADPLMPYVANEAKKGLAATGSVVPLVSDVAHVHGTQGPYRLGHDKVPKMLPGYERAAEKTLGFDPNMPVPKDPWGKPRIGAEVAGDIAGMAGASAIPEVGILGRAAKLGAGPLLKAATKEAGAIALSGEGETMGKHIAPKGHEAMGGFIGSLSGPMLFQSAVDAASKGGNWAKSKAGITGLSEEARKSMGRASAARDLLPQIESPVSRANIEEASKVGKQIPGFEKNLTLGRMTGSPAVASMERHFAGTRPDVLESAQAKEKALGSSIEGYKERQFPTQPEVHPFAGAQRTYADKVKRLEDGTTALERQERALASKYRRGDMETAGSQIRQVRERIMQNVKQTSRTMYDAVYSAANQQGLKVNMNDVKALASSINKDSANTFQDDPGVIGQIIRQYSKKAGATKEITTPIGRKIRLGESTRPESSTVDFQEFHSLYKKANAEASQLALAAKMGNVDAPQKLRKVMQVRDLLETKLNQMEGPEGGQVSALLKQANQFYRDKYVRLFKKGAGGQIGRETAFGPAQADAEIIPKLVFTRGDGSGVREYMAMIQGDPQGYRALESGVMDVFSKAVVRDGKIDRAALDRFMRDYKEPLAEMPGLRAQIDSASKASAAIKANADMIRTANQKLGSSLLAKVAKTENPDAMLTQAFRSPDRLRVILDSANSPEEKQALARAIVERVQKAPDPLAFMETNKKSLAQALGKKQYDSLSTILNAQKIVGRVEAPSHVQFGELEDPLKARFGTTIPQAISEQKGVSMRFASKQYAIARVAMRWWNKVRNDTREQVLIDAIYNPATAKDLADYLKSGSAVAASKLNDHLLAYGIRAAATASSLYQGAPTGATAPPPQ